MKYGFSYPIFLESPKSGYFTINFDDYGQKTYPVFSKLNHIR